MTAALIPEPDLYRIPLSRHRDLVIVLEPDAPATAWPGSLTSVVLIVDPPEGPSQEFTFELDPGRAELIVDKATVLQWTKGWSWTIQMNHGDYNDVPCNGVFYRAEGTRR